VECKFSALWNLNLTYYREVPFEGVDEDCKQVRYSITEAHKKLKNAGKIKNPRKSYHHRMKTQFKMANF